MNADALVSSVHVLFVTLHLIHLTCFKGGQFVWCASLTNSERELHVDMQFLARLIAM